MSARNRQGFTIAEVLVAIVMLSIGVMALVGSSAMVTRMVGQGRTATFAGQMATARVERLRQIAASTATACTSVLWKTDSASSGQMREKWEILDNAGNSRRLRITLRYPVARRVAVDTVLTRILCK
jgi:prepilin-type N-terminal cleavage/methylation domain-containing protein